MHSTIDCSIIFIQSLKKYFLSTKEFARPDELGDLMNSANENAKNRHTAEPTVAVP
jgi:hypothetical protein